MDLVKVFEQTVRDLKREVNLKVLKIPEIEQKVLDATDEEPWGPHGTALAEIAQAKKKFSECQMIMNVLWTRLTETGKNWRLVYKALTVVEYLVAHGSERAVDEIIEHTFQISSLASFEYVEPSGKDLGINVRKKAETIVSLLNDKDKIQEVRNKAATNRDKYFGLSSSGITYKSGTASFSSSNSRSSGQYGGFGDKGYGDSYKDSDEYEEEKYEKRVKPKTETPRYGSREKTSSGGGVSGKLKSSKKPQEHTSATSADALGSKYDEDTDDFDPRGSASLTPPGNSRSGPCFPDIDLFGEPLAAPIGKSASLENPSDVDLFADANFVSATPEAVVEKHSAPESVDLFSSHATPVVSTTVDFFGTLNPVPQPYSSAPESDKTSSIVDPFTSLPLNNFDEADTFGSFASNTYSLAAEPDKDSRHDDPPSQTKSTPAPKKDTFQVKSGIWADSLSRGLIDLNITAPKKVNLADVGIAPGLNDVEKGQPLPPIYMGAAMGSGYGMGRPGFASASGSTTDNFFSSLNDHQNQFGSFQK